MGLFDKLTGTKRPDTGVAPRSAEDVRAMLLSLNAPDIPYVVRDGAPEKADLVAEWRLMEPAWRSFFVRTQLGRRIRIRMRLVPADHEVRALDEQWEVKWVGDTPVSSKYGRGPVKTTSRRWTVGKGADGGLDATETFRFDSSELKDPLRDTVLKAGWTWRAVVYSRL
jgi:hypothetical protein